MRRLRRILGFLLGLEIAVLTATGIGLGFIYRPEDPEAAARSANRAADAFRQAHEVGAYAALATGASFALAVVGDGPWRHWRVLVRAAGVLALTPVVYITGTLLPWDDLVLGAGTSAGDVIGYISLPLDDAVRAVVIDGTEVEPTELMIRLAVHGFLTVVLVAFAFVRRPLPATPVVDDEPSPAASDLEDDDPG